MRMVVGLIVALLAIASPVHAQRAGSLVSAESMAGAPVGARAWRIRYASTSDRGVSEAVTGMVVVPRGAPPRDGWPVIAWAHGTWGVAPKCGLTGAAWFAATPALGDMLVRGYAVVATDYAGLGTPQPHPYLVGPSAAHAMLDAVRAARLIDGARTGSTFVPWGESQGGHAALWAGLSARGYAPELTLAGVAAAAPPTDLIENLTGGSDPSIRAFLTAFTADSWSRHYRVSLRSLGKPATGRLIGRLAKNNCIRLDAKPRLGTALGVLALRRDLRGVDLGKIEPWARIARDNSVAARAPGVPVLIAQNPGDKIVSPQVTRAYARRLCDAGGRVRFIDIRGEGHATSASDSARETLDWIDARFAREPAPSDCGRI